MFALPTRLPRPDRSFYRSAVAEPPPSSAPPRLAALLVVVVTAGNALWLHRHRLTSARDVDESAYLTLAFLASSPDHRIATTPWVLWQSTGHQAPLLPLATGLLHDVIGRTLYTSYLTNLVFLAVLLVATYALARRFTTGWWSLLAMSVVATTPGIVDYTRHYHFAIPAAATFTAALVALLRSERLTHRWWAVGFGVALAGVLLARTVMLAFAPGLVVAAVWAILAGATADRGRAFRNLALALLIAAIGAGSWYVFSAPDVWDYLTGYGYGTESTGYGAASMTSLRFWFSDPVAVVSDGFYLPLALVLAAGAAVGLATGPRGPGGWRARLQGEAVLVAVPLLLGFVALLTSRNAGTGFVLPLLPGAVVLTVHLLARSRPHVLATVGAVLLLAIALGNTAMKSNVTDSLQDEVTVTLAPWASLRVIDGDSVVDRYVRSETFPPTDEHPNGWDAAAREVLAAARADTPEGRTPDLFLTVDGALFNVPTLELEAQRGDRPRPNVGGVDRATIDQVAEDPAVLTRLLADLRDREVDHVVTGPAALAWRGYSLEESATTQAAAAAGYQPVTAIDLPDGRQVLLWSLREP